MVKVRKKYPIKSKSLYNSDYVRAHFKVVNAKNRYGRRYTVALCNLGGKECLGTYLKYFPDTTGCQNCEMEFGLIKEYRQHFCTHDLKGRLYPKRTIPLSIKQKLKKRGVNDLDIDILLSIKK